MESSIVLWNSLGVVYRRDLGVRWSGLEWPGSALELSGSVLEGPVIQQVGFSVIL